MQGNNTLILNQMEMNRAIEFYLKERIFRERVGVEVVGVKQASQGLGNLFHVEIKEQESLVKTQVLEESK